MPFATGEAKGMFNRDLLKGQFQASARGVLQNKPFDRLARVWKPAALVGALLAGGVMLAPLAARHAPTIVMLACLLPAILVASLRFGWPVGVATAAIGALALAALQPMVFAQSYALQAWVAGSIGAAALIAVGDAMRQDSIARSQSHAGAIETRDTMLKELRHRTYNNLQFVMALIRLQMRCADSTASTALESVLLRVNTLVEIERLLRVESGQSQAVYADIYLGDLCDKLQDSLMTDRSITLHADFDAVRIQRTRALALGLIVNELVTNAVKHAFAPQGGAISVTLKRHGDDCRLVVADNGRGLPENFGQSSGMGATLLKALARQARANLSITHTPSARFVIDLPFDADEAHEEADRNARPG